MRGEKSRAAGRSAKRQRSGKAQTATRPAKKPALVQQTKQGVAVANGSERQEDGEGSKGTYLDIAMEAEWSD